MKRACVIETESGPVVIRTQGGHVKGCMGHTGINTHPDDYKYLIKVDGVYVICKTKKSKDILETLNESISE